MSWGKGARLGRPDFHPRAAWATTLSGRRWVQQRGWLDAVPAVRKNVAPCCRICGNVREENVRDVHVSTHQNGHCSHPSRGHQVPLAVVTPDRRPNRKPGEEPRQ